MKNPNLSQRVMPLGRKWTNVLNKHTMYLIGDGRLSLAYAMIEKMLLYTMRHCVADDLTHKYL